jgi:NADPH:quinone reductase-like Zn-dependent oxidoreductase
VLVIGATGGVGTFAIQLAALRDAHVIASVRPGDESFVTDLGAGETVDYTADLIATIRERYPDGIDAVIDAVNRDQGAFAALASLVRDGGRATSVVGGAGEFHRRSEPSPNTGGHLRSSPALADLVVQGMVRVAIRRTYALDDAVQALQDFHHPAHTGQAGHLDGVGCRRTAPSCWWRQPQTIRRCSPE